MRNRTITKRWIGWAAGAALVAGSWAAAPRAWSAPPAQTGTPIVYGDTVSGEITEDVPCVTYWFEGQAGDPIVLDMQRTSGSLDGQLWLYLEDGSGADAIAFNDDRPSGGLNPLLDTTLPATDWYTVNACRLQHENMRVTVGTFTLTLAGPESSGEASGGGTNTESEAAATVLPTADGGLTDGLFPAGTATLPAGDASQSTPTATASGGLTGGLFPVGTPAATEEAAMEEPGGTAPFGYPPLADDAAQDVPPDTTVALGYDQPTAGYLWADQAERVHTLPVMAGDVVIVEWQQTADALQPRITVTLPDGTLIARVDLPDAVRGTRLEFVAPDVPEVLVHVARFDGVTDGSEGGYTLLARRAEDAQN